MTARSFSTDVALLTGVRFASVGAVFFTNVLAARLLGAAGLGAAAVAITLATISALIANGGLGISSVYFLGRRPDERRAIVSNVATMALGSIIVAAALVLASTPVIGSLLLPDRSVDVLFAGAVLASATVAAEIGAAALLGLHARGRYMTLEAMRTIGALVATAVIVLLGLRSEVAYVLAIAAATATAAAFGWLSAAHAAGPIQARLDGAFVRDALGMGMRGQAGNVLMFVNLRLDLLLVSALLRVEAAGVYLVAVRVAEVVVQVANAVSAFIFPRVAAQAQIGDTESTERATRVTLGIVGLSAVGLAILSEPVLAIAFGPAFVAGTTTLRLSLLAMVPLALSRILSGDLKGRGRADLVSVANLVGVVLTAALGLTLIPAFGIEGAALASIGAYAALTLALLAAYRSVTRAPLRRLVPRPADAVAAWNIGRRTIR